MESTVLNIIHADFLNRKPVHEGCMQDVCNGRTVFETIFVHIRPAALQQNRSLDSRP